MGLLQMRKNKIAKNATEFMEDGEEIQEMAMAQTQAPSLDAKKLAEYVSG